MQLGCPLVVPLALLLMSAWKWNSIRAMCPSQCTCDDVSLTAHCVDLDLVPITLNPDLLELHLSGNRIKNIKGSINVYHELKCIDMSHNQLVTLEEGAFQHQRNLKFLLLQRNMISYLTNISFVGLNALEVLHLNENILEEIPSGTFIQLSKLKTLDLSQNRISSFAEDGLDGLNNLKSLVLRDNKLAAIPMQALQKVTSLLDLNLGLNSFDVVPDNAFSALNSLKELSLDSCKIHSISNDAFKWLSSLLILNLQDNNLLEVPSKALLDVIRLEELNIGQNLFVSINDMSFERLRYLKVVRISGSPLLGRIYQNAFAENVNIEELVLNYNINLNIIEPGTFHSLPNLRYVSLRGNAFETLKYDVIPWGHISYLDVRDNPLVCNCSLLWLWHILRTKNFSKSDTSWALEGSELTKVLCSEPKVLKNRVLRNITAEDLQCGNDIKRRQIIIGTVATLVGFLIAILVLAVRHRVKIAGALKNKCSSSRKEPQYQKTSIGEEENNILQAAQQSLKMTPVTEL